MTNAKLTMTNKSENDKSLNGEDFLLISYLGFRDLFGFCHLDFGFSVIPFFHSSISQPKEQINKSTNQH